MILEALNRYYDRMAARGEATEPGWVRAQISWCIDLSAGGEPVAVRPLQDLTGRKPRPQSLSVPSVGTRTSGVKSNLLWDKTAYALGRTATATTRTAEAHAAFKKANLQLIADDQDAGLRALRRFLEKWKPERFDHAPFRIDMLDGNVVFRLESERGYIHERPAARTRLKKTATPVDLAESEMCLITGRRAPAVRLHPVIKGVDGAQSSGASLVSFNLDAFKSYGQDQGANAPVSREAAERYGAALNALLARRGQNRLGRSIGDATVVFWADASLPQQEEGAANTERLFSTLLGSAEDSTNGDAVDPFLAIFGTASASSDDAQHSDLSSDAVDAAKVRDVLAAIADGRPQKRAPTLPSSTEFHVLGLAPNSARLAVRFWFSGTVGHLAQALLLHMEDLAIKPLPRFWAASKGPPAVWRLLVKTTAVLEKFDNVPPQLAGEVMRSVLTARPYPRTWLATVVMRLRAGDPHNGRDDKDTGWHAAAIKACINRDPNEEDLPVALDPDNPSEAYQLGRLFALLETAQRSALGLRVNSTIADRYYASASATPARVFPSLLRGARHHIADLKKRDAGYWIESRLNSIVDRIQPDLPRVLRLEDQGRFAVGYYHERAFRGKAQPSDVEVADSTEAQ